MIYLSLQASSRKSVAASYLSDYSEKQVGKAKETYVQAYYSLTGKNR